MKRLLPQDGQAQLDNHLKRLPAARKRAITNSLNRAPAKTFANKLLKWFDQHGRKALPWQQNPTPYRVWVSEIMLQQTQVSTVIPYFERFMATFPTVTDLANADEDTVLHLWTGLGYYARARNLHKAAKKICSDYGGTLPTNTEALIGLPGIGQSTAGAIISLSDNIWAPILDGNVKRVLARVHRVKGPVQNTEVQHHLWALSHHYTPAKSAKPFNQAMMDIGATLCTRAKPNCTACPLKSLCSAHQLGQTDKFPEPKPSTTKPTKSATFLILENGNSLAQAAVLLEKRPSSGIWGGLWSFPEFDNEQAVIEYVKQNVPGIGKNAPSLEKSMRRLRPIKHIFTHFTLHITPVVIRLDKRHNSPLGTNYSRQTQWYALDDRPEVGLAAPVEQLLKQLQTHLTKATTASREVQAI